MTNFINNTKRIIHEAMLMMQEPTYSTLNEMAQITGKKSKFSFIVQINSEDHTPPHMHFIDKKTNKLLCKIAITENFPKTVDDIYDITELYLSISFRKEVLKWANSLNKRKVSYWLAAQLEWDHLHPED